MNEFWKLKYQQLQNEEQKTGSDFVLIQQSLQFNKKTCYKKGSKLPPAKRKHSWI